MGIDRIEALLQERRCAVARGSFLEYCLLMWPDEKPALHHLVIIQALQDMADGLFDRLLITAPPGSAKTAYFVRFATWYRGKHPSYDLIAASHTQELADKSSRRVRNTCFSEEWQEIWGGVEISGDSSAVHRWTTNRGGDYFATGVGGTVVGRRGMGVLLDDLSGGIADAMTSRLGRQEVWDWHVGDLLPRLKPRAWIAAIGTCFHSEDFIGKIRQLAEDGVENWKIINLPMIADSDSDVLGRAQGDLLWPEYFNQEMVDIARRNNDTWMALYQQKPIVESGQYFKREWMHEYDKRPENLRIYGASDYAVTHGGGDYTVHLVVGVSEEGKIYLLDCWRGQTSTDIWITELIRLMRLWKPIEWFEEKGQIQKGVGPVIEKTMRDERCYVYRSQYAMPRGADGANSKQVGAQSIRGRMAQGLVYFPRGVHWMPDMLSEMMAFPTEKSGIHDDLVDALSLFGRGLDTMTSAVAKKPKEGPKFLGIDIPLTIGAFIKHSEALRSPKRERI